MKHFDIEGIPFSALRKAVESGMTLRPMVAREIVPKVSSDGLTPREHMIATKEYLTPRELQVVRFLLQGMTTKSIAAEMGLQYSSVLSLIDRASKRLGSNRWNLLYDVHKRGWIQ